MLINQEIVKQLYNYNSKTGELIYKERKGRGSKGTRAGCLKPHGYRVLTINGKEYREHRIIWLYVYGHMPIEVDHKNLIKDDNKLKNLREGTSAQNHYNQKPRSKSGYKGIIKRGKKWTARINKKGYKTFCLGDFTTLKEAVIAYNEKAKELFGEFAYLNNVPGSKKRNEK